MSAEYNAYFAGKKVTLMGLGLLGRGVGDARFLAEAGAELIVTDLKTEAMLKSSLAELARLPITYRLGGHQLEDFRHRDLIVKAAGVPLNSPFIAEAKKNKIPVRMSADLLVELTGAKTVGVTGTRGKSTVTHLIAHTLRQVSKHVVLGGNIRGVSNLALLPEVRPESILVLELDSWQLQGFGEAAISPNVAVFTNLMQDHLNYYPDEQAYFADKANIFKYQKTGDTLIASRAVAEKWIASAKSPIAPKIPELGNWQLRIIGEHNRENASLAAEALRSLGLSEMEIKKGLESFEPVEGRLQFLREVGGVKIYNDNNATTPEGTVAALNSFDQKVILIAGGADKGLDLKPLIHVITDKVFTLVLLPGTGTDRLKQDHAAGIEVQTMVEAVDKAMQAAKAGDIVLFSPGFASFGLFNNEYDRNDQFVAIVNNL